MICLYIKKRLYEEKENFDYESINNFLLFIYFCFYKLTNLVNEDSIELYFLCFKTPSPFISKSPKWNKHPTWSSTMQPAIPAT